MKNRNSSHQVLKTSVTFPHLVPVRLLERYLCGSMPFNTAIKSIDVKFTVLTDDEDRALWEACMSECYPSSKNPAPRRAIDIDLPRLGMKGGAR